MSNPRGRPSSRDRILRAAVELAQEVGAGNISLDAVAERAGISKGGLLYNFPTKMSLLRALVAEHVQRSEARIAEAEAEAPASSYACLHAMIDVLCGDGNGAKRKKASGLLAAIAADPQLLDPVREHERRLVERLRRSPRPELALLAYSALEGLFNHDLLEFDVLTDEDRDRIIACIRQLLDESGTGTPVG